MAQPTTGTVALESGGSVTNDSFNVTIDATPNAALLVMAFCRSTSRKITSITFDGVSMGAALLDDLSNTLFRHQIFLLAAPAVGTKTLAFTFTDIHLDWVVVAVPLYGVHQTVSAGAALSNSGANGASGAVGPIDVSADSLTMAICTHSVGDIVATGTMTEIITEPGGIAPTTVAKGSDATVTFDLSSDSSRDWKVSALSINAVASAATTAERGQSPRISGQLYGTRADLA